MRQGTLCFKEYKNGTEELYDYSDLHISCKYGFWEWGQTPVQVGTITDASLQTSANYGFITISGDGQNIVADWDETQHVDQEPVIYDVVITVDNMKINKYSKGDPDTTGWYSIDDCQTIDGYEDNPLYFSSGTTNVYDLETQEETKAWSTTEPYFGTGVIADGAYFSSLNNYYIIIDGTNHPGELSFSQSDSWDPDNVLNYSKQTSGTMFYEWRSTDITHCTSLNHYTWNTSDVKLCYDNTTELIINGVTYTKQNPSPSYYEIKCQFNYGGSVRPAKTMIRWGTNEPYSEIIYRGLNPESFSWQESSVPSGEVGTLVVEFTDANYNGLLLDSFSSQDYTYDTDNAGSFGGTRLLIKTPDNSNIYDYSAGNFIECNITLSGAPQPATYTISGSISGQGTISGNNSPYNEGDTATLTAVPASGWTFNHWEDNDLATEVYTNPWTLNMNKDYDITVVFTQSGPTPTEPDLTGRYYFNSGYNYVIYFNTNQSLVFGECGSASAYNYEWTYTDHWILDIDLQGGHYNIPYDVDTDTFDFGGGIEFTYSSTDPCGGPGPQPTEKHIYLCDNSGAHLAEMTNTGSTWSVSGAFTSGMYSIRATVEGEYDDAWFKFYQTSGDNRVFVGAGDDPSFEDIGTYIMIDDILTLFSLTEDQETGYYVVSYENTGAMTVSMVDNIVNSYIGDFVTASDISEMGYMTATDISSMGYMTQTDISSMSYITMTDVQGLGYIDQTSLSNMSYVDQTSLSAMGYMTQTDISGMSYITMTDVQGLGYIDQATLSSMSYVDNSYLGSYMNAVVGDINSILQTI